MNPWGIRKVWVAVVLGLGLQHSAFAQTVYNGQLEGQFDVSPTGAATYTIPIEVPPGINGMQPDLALVYNSQGGNGPLGVGWNLAGLSAITRCPKTRATDGVISGVNLDMNDGLCLDGQRILPATSSTPAATCAAGGTLFRTEVDSFQKICAYGTAYAGTGYDYFEVTDSGGKTSQYGFNHVVNNSKHLVTLVTNGLVRVLAWKVNQTLDASGNGMDFLYSSLPITGEHEISSIQYNKVNGVAKSEVKFVRGTVNRGDMISTYVGGANVQTTKLVTDVSVFTEGVFIRKYHVNYFNRAVASADFSRIESIQNCTSEFDPAQCKIFKKLSTTVSGGVFNSNSLMKAPTQNAGRDGGAPGGWDYGVRMLDLNGDGLTDRIQGRYEPGSSYFNAWLNTGTDWQVAPNFKSPANFAGRDSSAWGGWDYGSRLVDLNGDGRTDIIQGHYNYGTSYYNAWLNTGTGWQEAPNYKSPAQFAGRDGGAPGGWDYGTNLVDLNGDGLVDILQGHYNYGTSYYNAWLNTGSGWVVAPNYSSPAQFAGRDGGAPGGWNYGTQLADLNGDGLVDILQGHYNYGTSYYNAWLNTGTGWQVASNYKPPAQFAGRDGGAQGGWDYGTRMVDLNGDGLADIIQGHYQPGASSFNAWLNTGTGWQVAPNYKSLAYFAGRDSSAWGGWDYGSRLVDLNGDGRTDIIQGHYNYGTSYYNAWLNTGTGWQVASSYNTTIQFAGRDGGTPGGWDSGTVLEDLNGDGLIDIIQGHYNYGSSYYNAWINSSQKPYLLNQVADATNVTQQITSTSLIKNGIYKKYSDSSFPTIDAIFPLYVVDNYTTTNGDGGTIKTSYYYEGAKLNLDGRGFVGFRKVIKTTENTATDTVIRAETTYNILPYTDFTRNGTVKLVESFLTKPSLALTNVPLGKTEFDWQIRLSDAGRNFPFVLKTTDTKYDYPTSTVRSTTVEGMNTSYTFTANAPLAGMDEFGNLWHKTKTVYEGLPNTGKYYTENTDSIYATNRTHWFDISKVTELTASKDVPDERPGAAGARLRQSVTTLYSYKLDSPKLATVTIAPKTGTNGGLNNLPVAENAANLTTTTSYEYDPTYGYPSKVTVTGDGVTAARITSTNIDYNYVSSYSHGRDVYRVTTTNSLNQRSFDEIEYATGQVITHVGPNGIVDLATGVTTLWDYDTWGRKIKETRADGSTTQWGYYACLDSTGAYVIDTLCDPGELYYTETASSGSSTSRAFIDKLGRNVRSQVEGYQNNLVESRTRYDGLGWVKGKTNSYYANTETPHWTCPFYDELGVVTGETVPSTLTAECASPSSAPRLNTIDTNGLYTKSTFHNSGSNGLVRDQIKQSWFNVIGQLIKVQDPTVPVQLTSGVASTASPTIHYYYGVHGSLIDVMDAKGNHIKTTYDRRGRKTQSIDPDLGTWRYTYNALGELLTQTDAKAQVVSMVYDSLGRLTKRSGGGEIDQWFFDRYQADAAGTSTCTKGIGKPCETVSSTGYRQKYTYNNLGRAVTELTTIRDPQTNVLTTYQMDKSYDSNGRVATQTYPATKDNSRFVVQNCYSLNGYLTQVRSPGDCNIPTGAYWRLGDGAATSVIDARGRVLSEILGSNISSSRTYDPELGRLTDISTGIGANGQILQDNFYDYDLAGNLIQRQYASKAGIVSDITDTYSYDDLNRLQTAAIDDPILPTVTKTYGYDAIGNIMQKSDFANFYVYDTVKVHAVKTVHNGSVTSPVATYVYDANGFMTNNKGQILSPTWFGKPSTITGNGITTTFRYDSGHSRISQSKAGHYTIYLNPRIDLGGHYEKEVDTATTTKVVKHKHYLYGATGVIGVYEKKETTSPTNVTTVAVDTNYFLKDHLGSIEVILNANGTQKERHRYDVFGKRLTPVGTNHHGFTGHEHLDDYGLINMNARLYNPDLGRFMAADTVVSQPGSTQGFNRYSYTDNNPLSRVDLSGHSWWSDNVTKPWREHVFTEHRQGLLVRNYAIQQSVSIGAAIGFYYGGPAGAVAGAYGGYRGYQAYREARDMGLGMNDSLKYASMVALGKGLQAYSYLSMAVGFENALLNDENLVAHAINVAADKYVQRKAGEEVARFAERNGMSKDRLNAYLLFLSIIGNAGESRLTVVPAGTTGFAPGEFVGDEFIDIAVISGIGNRGILGGLFDAVDIVLAYQGLPTATSLQYIYSARGMHIDAHSLGSMDANNLLAYGFAPSADLRAMPFGRFAMPGGVVHQNAYDPVSGGPLGLITRPGSNSIYVPWTSDNSMGHGRLEVFRNNYL